jgi:hypothetical protein
MMNMKRCFLGILLMGVLGGCSTTYRIKEVTLLSGDRYYFPQRKGFPIGEWKDLSREGSYTKRWAYEAIREDKRREERVKIKYIKIVQ